MKKVYLCIAILLALSACATPAEAKPHMLTWTWPSTDCDGEVLLVTDLLESELIYSNVPMPMPSDTDGACSASADPDAPPGSLLVPIPTSDNAATLNLQPGQTYYARIRVSAYVAGNWSSWSDQHQFTVPYGRPNKIILADGWLRWEATEISVTYLRFKG